MISSDYEGPPFVTILYYRCPIAHLCSLLPVHSLPRSKFWSSISTSIKEHCSIFQRACVKEIHLPCVSKDICTLNPVTEIPSPELSIAQLLFTSQLQEIKSAWHYLKAPEQSLSSKPSNLCTESNQGTVPSHINLWENPVVNHVLDSHLLESLFILLGQSEKN